MKTNTYLWWYLAEFFLEWEIFQATVAEKVKTNISRTVTFFFGMKSYGLWDNVEKYYRAGQTTDDNMAHAYCMLYT